jgi:hypothetical protein
MKIELHLQNPVFCQFKGIHFKNILKFNYTIFIEANTELEIKQ